MRSIAVGVATSVVAVKTASTCTSSSRWVRRSAWIAVGALALAACGGDDDDAATSTTTATTLAPAPTDAPLTTDPPASTATTEPSEPTATTAPTVLDLVTEGATVVVANASTVDGAAGRMTDRLAVAGFTMGTATNGSEGQLEVTKIYYDPANEDAQAVAESLRAALGGGDIQLFEMGVPAPVESGDIGDASIVVAMGNDTADRSLEELQGLVVPDSTDDTGDGEGTDTTEPTETTAPADG
jgi:hypothetical protein